MYTVYTGEHVRLRPFASADELTGCSVENSSANFVHWGPHQLDLAGERRSYAEDGCLPWPGNGRFAIELMDGELAGASYYGVSRSGIVAAVGTFVMERHRHKRVGVEARQLCICFIFDHLPVAKIEAITLSNNVAAIRSLERCGLALEGVQRGMYFSQGKRESYLYYVMFREQWEAMDYRHRVKRGS